MFRRKKDELYEGQNDSKFSKFLKPLKKALFNIVYVIAKRFGMSTPEHYDLAIDEVIVSPYALQEKVCTIIFLVYGFLCGIFGEQYAEYICKSFNAYCMHHSLSSDNITSSPLTMLGDIVISCSIYFVIITLGFVMYNIMKCVFLKDAGDEEIEKLQIAMMYGLLEIVLLSLLFFILPFNIFIALRM